MSYVKVGNNFYSCDSIDDVDYTWPESSRIYIKGTESYNGNYYILTGGALIFKYSQESIPFAPDVLPTNKIIVSTTAPTGIIDFGTIWIDIS